MLTSLSPNFYSSIAILRLKQNSSMPSTVAQGPSPTTHSPSPSEYKKLITIADEL
ncbi:hypothetical protein CsatA_015536 [Cannabis sativa]